MNQSYLLKPFENKDTKESNVVSIEIAAEGLEGLYQSANDIASQIKLRFQNEKDNILYESLAPGVLVDAQGNCYQIIICNTAYGVTVSSYGVRISLRVAIEHLPLEQKQRLYPELQKLYLLADTLIPDDVRKKLNIKHNHSSKAIEINNFITAYFRELHLAAIEEKNAIQAQAKHYLQAKNARTMEYKHAAETPSLEAAKDR